MRNLFSYDNSPLIAGLSKFYRLMGACALFLVFSLPILTAGASLTAFYYTIQTNLKYNRGYVWQCFWDSFRRNFGPATRLWLLFLAFAGILLLDIGMLRYLSQAGHSFFALEVLLYVLCAALGAYAIWVFALLARFDNSPRATLHNAAVLALLHFPRSVLIAILLALTVVIVWVMPYAVLLLPGACLWIINILLESVFRVNMTPEQRAQEDERNRLTQGE